MDAERRVKEIRQRHADFVAQYSPGSDWEPYNQMSEDRGWLLAHIETLTTRLHEAERALIACGYEPKVVTPALSPAPKENK